MKSGNLNFLEPCGPLQACNGTALRLPIIYVVNLHDVWRFEFTSAYMVFGCHCSLYKNNFLFVVISNSGSRLRCCISYGQSHEEGREQTVLHRLYTLSNKNPSAWNFLSPEPEVMCGTVSIIIWILLLPPYLHIRGVSVSSIHYNHSHHVYINQRQQYICLIWN